MRNALHTIVTFLLGDTYTLVFVFDEVLNVLLRTLLLLLFLRPKSLVEIVEMATSVILQFSLSLCPIDAVVFARVHLFVILLFGCPNHV